MPNSHNKSSLMRVQNETKQVIETIASQERRAANAQLAVIVDEWCTLTGRTVDVSRTGTEPARRNSPARP